MSASYKLKSAPRKSNIFGVQFILRATVRTEEERAVHRGRKGGLVTHTNRDYISFEAKWDPFVRTNPKDLK